MGTNMDTNGVLGSLIQWVSKRPMDTYGRWLASQIPVSQPGHTDVMKAAKLDKSMVVIFWPGHCDSILVWEYLSSCQGGYV